MLRDGDGATELLDSPEKLGVWALASGVVSKPTSCGRDALADAIELREAIYRLAGARIKGQPALASDLAILNRRGQVAPAAVVLGPDGTLSRSGSSASVLATIARDAIELLGGKDVRLLHRCGREGCTRMFIDHSRGANRTWCGMRECGNRVNAAAYRRRKHHTPAES
jgi:predicted RNA-binding Zn ribbon-like protein